MSSNSIPMDRLMGRLSVHYYYNTMFPVVADDDESIIRDDQTGRLGERTARVTVSSAFCGAQ